MVIPSVCHLVKYKSPILITMEITTVTEAAEVEEAEAVVVIAAIGIVRVGEAEMGEVQKAFWTWIQRCCITRLVSYCSKYTTSGVLCLVVIHMHFALFV